MFEIGLGLSLAVFMFALFRWGVIIGHNEGLRKAARIHHIEVPLLSRWFPFKR